MDIPMSVEQHAQRIIERETQRRVVLHDDGSASGLYDLRIGDAASPEVAIECVGALDPIRTETWNIGPAQGPISTALRGDWSVELHPNARIKPIFAQIESLLRECEENHLLGFLPIDWSLRRANQALYSALGRLRIESIHCFRPNGSGEVHLDMTGIGGVVNTRGDEVAGWISGFLRAPARADVLSKLGKSRARECHVFVPVAFASVPWAVESYLERTIEVLPDSPPDLPVPVDAVWITYGANGLLWNGVAWRLFNAFVPPADP
jgi:hypothetical protein